MANAREESPCSGVDEGPGDVQLVRLGAAVGRAFDSITACISGDETSPVRCMTTGMPSFDRLIGGLRRKDLILLAGEPGVGKTTLALQWAREAALQHASESVVFCTLETTSEQLAKRLLSMHCTVPLASWEKPMATENVRRLVMAGGELDRLHFFFDDTLDLSLAQLARILGSLSKERPLALLAVDSIDLMPEALEGTLARQAAVCLTLRQLARLVNCPAVAVLNAAPVQTPRAP